ncbi:uncharacterized protein APUU_70199S [Aspergillus puulaauensis]|uniref:Uncharacterized protein n=1 Tax=Aspergillus puulaauensis TaxID=1220207 RepID=A0A7R8AQT4_9EURO|nr:uncharacterized protein APUU_70199S [Aspergillus puulaauensis]BCS28629.1 hypothetical protein APUU_70199S [Aspergillus puulaauensis]
MSRTETTNTTALSVLADYELHHSGNSQNTTSPSPSPSPPQQQQPANWPTNHRRVPPYRPVDRSLSFEERAAGSNVPEFIFIQSMLHGCWLNASVARLWRFTGGRINDRIFHYEIGGEY